MRDTIEMAREVGFTVGLGSPALEKFERLIAMARADEREAIKDEWWMCVQSDLENGVKSLNEQAATKWRKEYPEIAKFGAWLNERGEIK
jgi:hypothetical protein